MKQTGAMSFSAVDFYFSFIWGGSFLNKKQGTRRSRARVFKWLFVFAFVAIVGIGLIRENIERWKLLHEPYKQYNIYGVLETCKIYFGNVKLDNFFFHEPRFYCRDDLGNQYAFSILEKDNLTIYKNGKSLLPEQVDELYEKIFKGVIVETIKRQPPANFEGCDPNSIFSYLKGWVDEYIYNEGRHFVKFSGMDSVGNIVDVVYEVKKVNNKVKVYVDHILVNGRQLNENERRVLLAIIYKKKIEQEVLETVVNGYLPELSEATLGEVLGKLPSSRFYLFNEKEKLVEFTAYENFGTSQDVKRITIRFHVNDYGYISVVYFMVNDVEKTVKEAHEYIKKVYKKFGYLTDEQEREKYKRRILASTVPGRAITFNEFVQQYLKDVSWVVTIEGDKVMVRLEAHTKNSNKALWLLFELPRERMESPIVKDVNYNGLKVSLNEVLSDIMPREVANVRNETTNDEKAKIAAVQSSLSVAGSKFSNNKIAVESFLKDVKWSVNKNTVEVRAKGKYLGKFMDFKIVFSTNNVAKPAIDSVSIDGKQCPSNIAEYIIGKIYGIDKSNLLVAHVKNSKVLNEPLKNLLKTGEWNVDTNSDKVNYQENDFLISFAVSPSGKVEVFHIGANGKDLTDLTDKFFIALESHKSVKEAINDVLYEETRETELAISPDSIEEESRPEMEVEETFEGTTNTFTEQSGIDDEVDTGINVQETENVDSTESIELWDETLPNTTDPSLAEPRCNDNSDGSKEEDYSYGEL